jgi:hypothetical protein
MSDIINDEIVEKWNEEDEVDSIAETKTSDDLIKKYSETQIRVVRSGLDLPLQVLKDNIGKKDYINISPAFQRRGRWDNKKRSLLIESFLLNIPIPPVFLYENTYNQYEVMDGRQRIESIYEFLDNGFELTGLEYWKELNGSRFKDLPDTIQRGLLRRTLNAIVLLTETNNIDDVDIRMILFNRLNTGGIQLNPHELRNAIYQSRFNDLIKKLSRDDLFTKLWKIPKKELDEEIRPSRVLANNLLYKSMLDCELVLRFFAIREAVSGKFKGSLRSILDKTMQAHQQDDEITCKKNYELFIETIRNLFKAYNGKQFILLNDNKRYSRPLYDAITVAYSFAYERNEVDTNADLPKVFSEALSITDTYEVLIGRANTLQAIKDRVALAYKLITNKDFV